MYPCISVCSIHHVDRVALHSKPVTGCWWPNPAAELAARAGTRCRS